MRSKERIDKLLSNLGYCSRRQTDQFLREHHVTIDGVRVRDGAGKADPHKLLVNWEPLDHPDGLFILLNKPAGYVCSHDQSEGALVYDLLPPQWMKRNPVPSSIGRLDKDTTGVLIITDNTALNHKLSSPRHKVDKVYEATVDKVLDESIKEIFASGNLRLTGEEKPCLPADLEINDKYLATVTIHEGRYHQVKRMFSACGYTVLNLHRSRFGVYTTESLKEGEFRVLPFPD